MASPDRHDLQALERARRDVVQVSRQVLAGERGIIAASRDLWRLGHDVVPDWRDDDDFRLFGAIDTETDHLPLEDMRPLWDATAFEAKQAEIRRLETLYRADADAACRSLIERFGGDRDDAAPRA